VIDISAEDFDRVAPLIDLIYDRSFVPALKARFPNMAVDDASDDLHPERVEVSVETSQREWARVLMQTKAASVSFFFHLRARIPEYQPFLREVLQEVKAADGGT
jgi:hypothetical protein